MARTIIQGDALAVANGFHQGVFEGWSSGGDILMLAHFFECEPGVDEQSENARIDDGDADGACVVDGLLAAGDEDNGAQRGEETPLIDGEWLSVFESECDD